jgi:hypothetical protein
MDKLNAEDWIALRLLYIMMASDPSVCTLPDVQKTLRYYEDKLRPEGAGKYTSGYVMQAFALLNKDIPYDSATFANPEVRLTRDVAPVVHGNQGAFEDAGSGYSVPETVRKEMEENNGNDT